MSVKTDLSFSVKVKEEEANDLGTSRLTHTLELVKFYGSGTSANQFDVVYSDSNTASASAVTYDVNGSLKSVLSGENANFVTLCGVIVANKSKTSTEILTIGGGANSIGAMWGAPDDKVKIGPGGLFCWWDPQDGVSPAAGVSDTLQIDPGSDNITFEIVLLGRSS